MLSFPRIKWLRKFKISSPGWSSSSTFHVDAADFIWKRKRIEPSNAKKGSSVGLRFTVNMEKQKSTFLNISPLEIALSEQIYPFISQKGTAFEVPLSRARWLTLLRAHLAQAKIIQRKRQTDYKKIYHFLLLKMLEKWLKLMIKFLNQI